MVSGEWILYQYRPPGPGLPHSLHAAGHETSRPRGAWTSRPRGETRCTQARPTVTLLGRSREEGGWRMADGPPGYGSTGHTRARRCPAYPPAWPWPRPAPSRAACEPCCSPWRHCRSSRAAAPPSTAAASSSPAGTSTAPRAGPGSQSAPQCCESSTGKPLEHTRAQSMPQREHAVPPNPATDAGSDARLRQRPAAVVLGVRAVIQQGGEHLEAAGRRELQLVVQRAEAARRAGSKREASCHTRARIAPRTPRSTTARVGAGDQTCVSRRTRRRRTSVRAPRRPSWRR